MPLSLSFHRFFFKQRFQGMSQKNLGESMLIQSLKDRVSHLRIQLALENSLCKTPLPLRPATPRVPSLTVPPKTEELGPQRKGVTNFSSIEKSRLLLALADIPDIPAHLLKTVYSQVQRDKP